ncbi:MAG: hypothetical protein M3N34_03575 [Pseudomonadota bacterium]|nr:hypothetical protein [Pseudomonadota bacterium]
MTLRKIQWIADSGLLVGFTTIGEFAAPQVLGALSLSTAGLTRGVAASGMILGASSGSTITATGVPAGLTINAVPGWAYDGSGLAGSYAIVLTETLSGSANSPHTSGITVTITSPAGLPAAMLDFSQSANSGLIAATRSF